jgi:hypothetical protein
MRDAGGIELGCCKSKWKLQMYEQPRAAANLRTGQCALAKACSGAKPTQPGRYGSKPAQWVRFGIEHYVIEIQC